MGNFQSSATASKLQLIFALFWPVAVVYVIMKLLVEKLWSRDGAVERFRERREKGFAQFEHLSNPADLVGNERIVGGNQSVEDIEHTFNTILALDLEPLRKSLQDEKYNAYTVLCAFVWRALRIQREINCLTEVILEAFQTSKSLDDEFYQTGKAKKPLYGLPFSVKSNFNVKGYDVTVGLAKLLEQPKETTCPFVQFLSDQGAVPFALTNVPQGLLSYVSSNPLYGTTKNPWDFARTPGGSSGGEAALLAAGGAAFGTGSDLAGSLRIPAAFCGLVTLKPTQDRFYVTDTHGGLPGRGRLGLSFGFYTRSVAEQEYLLRLIVGNPEYRELCPLSAPAPMIELSTDAKPVIGYYFNDGFNPVVPSNRRAVVETVKKLEAEGYRCVEFRLQDVDTDFQPFVVADMLFRNVMPDNGAYMAQMYNGEKYDEHMKKFIGLVVAKQIGPVRLLAQLLMPLARALYSRRLAALGSARNSNLAECRQNQENTDVYRLKWIKYWKSLGIDALICPSFITPAQPFEYPGELATGAFITGLFNLLDVPAGIVPVSPVTSEDIALLSADNASGFRTEGDALLRKQRDAAKGSEGLPNAVQIVTLPNEEELCLKVMKIVEDVSEGVERLQWQDGAAAESLKTSQTLFKRIPL